MRISSKILETSNLRFSLHKNQRDDFRSENSNVRGIGIVLNNFQVWFYSTFSIWVKFSGQKVPKFPEFNMAIHIKLISNKQTKIMMSSLSQTLCFNLRPSCHQTFKLVRTRLTQSSSSHWNPVNPDQTSPESKKNFEILAEADLSTERFRLKTFRKSYFFSEIVWVYDHFFFRKVLKWNHYEIELWFDKFVHETP